MADHPYPADGSDIPKERARAGSSSAGGRVHGFLHEAESRSDPHAVAELPPEEGQLQESRQEFYHRSHGNECSAYLLYIIALWKYAVDNSCIGNITNGGGSCCCSSSSRSSSDIYSSRTSNRFSVSLHAYFLENY